MLPGCATAVVMVILESITDYSFHRLLDVGKAGTHQLKWWVLEQEGCHVKHVQFVREL